MLREEIVDMYKKFRLGFYQHMMKKFKNDNSGLSETEILTIEIISLLKEPTISKYAKYMNLSLQNANYKVNSLLKKGYISKTISPIDKREFILKTTDKFENQYGKNDEFILYFMKTIEDSFSEEEYNQFTDYIRKINNLL